MVQVSVGTSNLPTLTFRPSDRIGNRKIMLAVVDDVDYQFQVSESELRCKLCRMSNCYVHTLPIFNM